MATSTARSGGGSMMDIVVNAVLQESDRNERRPRLTAYAFSQGGRLLGTQNMDTQGQATLKVPRVSGATMIRVMVGPEREGHTPDIADLLRVGATESHLRLGPESRNLTVTLHLLSAVWLPWLLGLCCVRGTLDKRYANGVELPVCNAVVEVYEVEPWWLILPKIPVDILGKLRQVIAGTLVPPSLPVPPRPGPVENAAFIARTSAARKAPSPQAAMDFVHLRPAAMSANDFAFRQVLVDQEALIRPLLCWLWPRFVTYHLVGTATTDQCGHFQLCFFKGFGNTGPTNLYFKAKTRFLFWPPTSYIYIYDPTPIGCHTWWNYVCGSEVHLVTTSPWAHACPPCFPVIAPDNWVMFTAIGNTSLSTVNGTGEALIPTTTTGNLGLTEAGAPWGATLLPRLDFDDSLRLSLGVKYYQVSWRRGTSGAFAPITTGDIYRHYIYTPPGPSNPVIAPYHLGPQTVGTTPGLFEIPPAVPPQGQWTIVDAVADTASAQFATDIAGIAPGITYLADGTPVGSDQSGLFQLQVALFDASGNAVNITTSGIKYVIPTSADLTQTINTADASTIAQPGGGTLVQGNDLIVSLYVNNNRCFAGIHAPTINGTAADDCCGVLTYASGDSVTMAWTALQTGGFATFNFDLYRGANEVWTDDGQPVGGGAFSESQSVGTLMGPNASCAETCTLAGFSQNLGVYAMATNGWSRLSGYDSSAVWAFVLAAQ
jgi:hypothetical protein